MEWKWEWVEQAKGEEAWALYNAQEQAVLRIETSPYGDVSIVSEVPGAFDLIASALDMAGRVKALEAAWEAVVARDPQLAEEIAEEMSRRNAARERQGEQVMPEKPWLALKRRQLGERLDLVTSTVCKHNGNRQRAANEIGVKESWLRELISTYELPVPPAPTRGRPKKGT